ncbi:MAG: RIP metalloprotease RseP [Acidobacteriia bacterium]|nr:RIP metalloprotease RseP [Terriglobia bacterium]
MENFFVDLAAVAVVLGIMIVVHEFGHFAAAKLFDVRVDQFAIGFGKRLFGIKKGETDYRFNALPFGGYVKMAGENPLEAHSGDPREFTSKPRWQRFIIAFAGPFANVVLAIALLTGVFMVRYEHPVYLNQPAVIGWVLDNSSAQKAGIQAGDRIVRIEDVQNPTWEDVLPKVVMSPGQPVTLAIQRGDQILEKTIVPTPTGPEEFGNPGWLPDQPNTVTEIEPSLPAAKAGIRVGDTIVALNGQPTRSMQAVIREIQANKDKPLTLTAVRDNKELNFTVTPMLTELNGKQMWRIGIRSEPQQVDKLPFGKAFVKSLDQNKRNSFLIIELVEKMVQRKVSVKQFSSPIGIAQASGEAARQQGWTPLLALMSAISLNLAIFNLFPFPILDGGMILFLAIEGIRRRDISLRLKERIYQLAFVLLILFAVIVIYNDLAKTLPGLQRLP